MQYLHATGGRARAHILRAGTERTRLGFRALCSQQYNVQPSDERRLPLCPLCEDVRARAVAAALLALETYT